MLHCVSAQPKANLWSKKFIWSVCIAEKLLVSAGGGDVLSNAKVRSPCKTLGPFSVNQARGPWFIFDNITKLCIVF